MLIIMINNNCMVIHNIVLNKEDIKTNRNGYNFMLTTTEGMNIIFTPDAISELVNDSVQYMRDMRNTLGSSFIESMYTNMIAERQPQQPGDEMKTDIVQQNNVTN